MNVTDMGEADAKRLVDFSAGLVFGLHGSIERVTNKVFLLTPSSIEVLGEDKKVSDGQTTFFNQS
jgi:cell division inhibitor SepF